MRHKLYFEYIDGKKGEEDTIRSVVRGSSAKIIFAIHKSIQGEPSILPILQSAIMHIELQGITGINEDKN